MDKFVVLPSPIGLLFKEQEDAQSDQAPAFFVELYPVEGEMFVSLQIEGRLRTMPIADFLELAEKVKQGYNDIRSPLAKMPGQK